MQWRSRTFTWPDVDQPDTGLFEREGWPVLYVEVTTPEDQAQLHRQLALVGYCPVLIEETPTVHRWQFTHPDAQ